MRKKRKEDIKFLLKENPDKTAYIRARLNANNRQFDYGTGIVIETKFWDAAKKRAKTNMPDFEQVNQKLEQISEEIILVYNQFAKENNQYFTRSEFKEQLDKVRKLDGRFKSSKDGSFPFIFHWKEFIADGIAGKIIPQNKTANAAKPWNSETARRYNNFSELWKKFNKTISLNEFSINSLERFVAYLIKTGHANTTIHKELQILKLYTRWLIASKLIRGDVEDDLSKFKPGLKRISDSDLRSTNNISLSQQEVDKIIETELPGKYSNLERVRDIFVFQIYTGLRYGDLYALQKQNYNPNKATNGIIDFVSIKGQKRLIVPLSQKCKTIIEKYKNYPGPTLLPCSSNQKFNKALKRLGEVCGIDEIISYRSFVGTSEKLKTGPKHKHLTSHIARKTYINILLLKGVPAEIVAALVGDSLEVIMKHYRSVKETDLLSVANVFD